MACMLSNDRQAIFILLVFRNGFDPLGYHRTDCAAFRVRRGDDGALAIYPS